MLGLSMYCSQCGKEIKSELVSAEALTKEKKRQRAHYRGRRLGNLFVSVIALIILFTTNREVPKASVFVAHQADTSYLAVQNQSETVILSTKGEWCAIDTPSKLLYSADHKQMAYIDQDGELYALRDVTPVYLDEDVLQARMSFYGDTLGYIKRNQEQRQELCICLLSTQKTDCLPIENSDAFVLSPNGKTAACLEEDGTLSVWQYGKKEQKIANGVSSVLSVADSGTPLFYVREQNELCAHTFFGEQTLCTLSGDYCYHYLLNETQTELLCTNDNNTYYYAAPMSEALRLTGVKGMLFFSAPTNDITYPLDQNGMVLGRRSLKNRTFVTYDEKNQTYKIYQMDFDGQQAELLLKTSAL